MSITTEVINGPVSIFELGSIVLTGLGITLMTLGITARITGSEKDAPPRLGTDFTMPVML